MPKSDHAVAPYRGIKIKVSALKGEILDGAFEATAEIPGGKTFASGPYFSAEAEAKAVERIKRLIDKAYL